MYEYTYNIYRQLFCWTDKWYGMSIQDIRDLEAKTKLDLDNNRNQGEIAGTKVENL